MAELLGDVDAEDAYDADDSDEDKTSILQRVVRSLYEGEPNSPDRHDRAMNRIDWALRVVEGLQIRHNTSELTQLRERLLALEIAEGS